jgi:hypothetical protein
MSKAWTWCHFSVNSLADLHAASKKTMVSFRANSLRLEKAPLPVSAISDRRDAIWPSPAEFAKERRESAKQCAGIFGTRETFHPEWERETALPGQEQPASATEKKHAQNSGTGVVAKPDVCSGRLLVPSLTTEIVLQVLRNFTAISIVQDTIRKIRKI